MPGARAAKSRPILKVAMSFDVSGGRGARFCGAAGAGARLLSYGRLRGALTLAPGALMRKAGAVGRQGDNGW
jgi:hypothetical protein